MSDTQHATNRDATEQDEHECEMCGLLKKKISVLENLNKCLARKNRTLRAKIQQERMYQDISSPDKVEGSQAECPDEKQTTQTIQRDLKDLAIPDELHEELKARLEKMAKDNIDLQLKIYELKCERRRILPIAFHNDSKPTFSFVNPYNCGGSCVLCVVFFVFYMMNLRICNRKFDAEMRRRLSEILAPDADVGKCISSLEYLARLGLIVELDKGFGIKEVNSVAEIHTALKEAHLVMKEQSYPCLLCVRYTKEEEGDGHCVAIMPKTREICDIKKNLGRWPGCDERFGEIKEIGLYEIIEIEAKEWEKICEDNCGDSSELCVAQGDVGRDSVPG